MYSGPKNINIKRKNMNGKQKNMNGRLKNMNGKTNCSYTNGFAINIKPPLLYGRQCLYRKNRNVEGNQCPPASFRQDI